VSSAGHRRTLAGRYRLEEVIGRGGMSTVYRATDLSLDRVVAVKVAMDPLLERDPVYVARFKREARAAAALSHPGAVTVFDAGADDATRYIVMECVDGRDLAKVLRDEGPLEPARAAHITEQVADTLAAAHAAGIVHRDVKPGNVMVEGRPPAERAKVLDFGIARTPDAVSLTQTASVLGTAPYMSPEQAMGQPADARSDIYSLGCVLYEMLTGKPPFTAEVPAAVLHQHVRVAPKPPRELNPAIPPALDGLVLQMLAKDPGDRPQTAAEVRDRLADFDTATAPTRPLPAVEALTAAAAAAAEVPQMATVPQAATPPPATPIPPQPSAPTRPLTPGRPPRRAPWAFLAVVALLLLGAAVAYAVAGGGSSASSSSQSHSPTPARGSSTGSSSHSTSIPSSSSKSSSSSSSSTPSTSSSTASTTTTTATTTTSTAPGPPGGAPPTPPGKGGTPPGKAKKGKSK
jgi:serine/threonine-protein kinase